MTGKQKILEVAKTTKLFRVEDTGVPPNSARKYIQRLVNEGVVERVGYGLYSLADAELTEHQSILEVSAKIPEAVICLISALQFHGLTTQNPFAVWLAIPRGKRYPKRDGTRIRVFRFSPQAYENGIEKHLIDGVEVKVYSPAKTIADCFAYQKTVGLDVCIEALRDAWRQRKVTMDELYHFARIRNVKGTMLPYLNTLT